VLIDWFTVCAQVLNFLILIWLLKRFLYKPILDAIDAREKRIAAAIADAEAGKSQAEKQREEFRKKHAAFDAERAALFARADAEAKAAGATLLADAGRAADDLSAKRQEALRNDARDMHQAIARRTQQEVFAIARKALSDLATVGLEDSMTEVFIRRLGEMEGTAKELMAQALKPGAEGASTPPVPSLPAPALVRSAFELPERLRADIRKALKQAFSAEIIPRFETATELVGGIEFVANGRKVSWSIAAYLASLESGVAELMDSRTKGIPEPKNHTGAGPALVGAPDAVLT
jgi:F-type H+-transporting ATPase subunit b